MKHAFLTSSRKMCGASPIPFVFAFTLDICFYFENIRAKKEHWRLQRFSHVSTEFKIIQLKI